MSVINNSLLATPEGYQISRSVRLRSSASAYFSATLGSGNKRTFTYSLWVKRGTLGVAQTLLGTNSGTAALPRFYFTAADQLEWSSRDSSSVIQSQITTTAVYRDPSAWYHIVFAYDTTQAVAADRLSIYVNGALQAVTITTALALNEEPNSTFPYGDALIGIYRTTSFALPFYGYLTEVNFIDGQALTPSSFGQTNAVTGVWQPIKYIGTYGTNGFYLNFSDNSAATAAAIGKDYSGNGNNWTPNNISVTAGVTYDSMLDTPTPYADGGNGRGNYAVLNPVAPNPSTTASTCADGNLTASASAANTMRKATIGITSGAYYFEATLGSTVQGFGLGEAAVNSFGTNSASTGARTYYLYNGGANLYTILPSADTSITTTVGSGGTLAVAVDMTNKKLWLGYAASGGGNITWIGGGSPSAGTSPTHTFASDVSEVFPLALTNGPALYCNFGQRPFSYTPPTGFVALNTQNLPDATIKKGNQYFDVVTRTGTGTADGQSQVISSLAFTPDLVWNKARSNAFNHNLVDSARGNDAILFSNLTNAETSVGTTGTQLQITANGFTAIQRVSYQATNQNGVTYADWCWKESASAGFDIVTYTGDGTTNRTVAHSLGVQPSMFIIKARSAATTSWMVHHKDLGNNGGSPAYLQYLQLESTAAKAASTSLLPVVGLSSTTFPTSGATNNTNVNGNGTTYVAYLFSEVLGYSKFGSYTGNGSADGPFVYCGFRPRFIMVKRTDSTSNWTIHDTSRDLYNVALNNVFANLSNAEAANANTQNDILSNGFKVRHTAGVYNANGGTYIFAAFAENPFKNSLAR